MEQVLDDPRTKEESHAAAPDFELLQEFFEEAWELELALERS